MEIFVQQLINGLTLGSIYGLIAIGYTMVFGIIGMVNFAHGDVFMLSAFISLIFFAWTFPANQVNFNWNYLPDDGAQLRLALGCSHAANAAATSVTARRPDRCSGRLIRPAGRAHH
jgi:branched-subunit amino acid ABC-type transport system permease component